MLPWLNDRQLAAFAVRVIRKAADFGAKQEAIAALRAALLLLQEPYLGDARSALAELGARDAAPRVRVARTPTVGSIASTNELVIRKVYRRKDLHDSGLGGNRQKGISYGADATEVLLFPTRPRPTNGGIGTVGMGPTPIGTTANGAARAT